MSYSEYSHLLGRAYIPGKQDCYGLARDYYRDVYGIKLVDAARPDGWWNEKDINLIDDFLDADGWENLGTNTKLLKPGDGLIFSLISGKANHVGIYVGNGAFIHHVWNTYSREDALLEKWKARLLAVIRHPEVAKVRNEMQSKVDITHFLPERYRARAV